MGRLNEHKLLALVKGNKPIVIAVVDGTGLSLRITPTSAAWQLRYRIHRRGKALLNIDPSLMIARDINFGLSELRAHFRESPDAYTVVIQHLRCFKRAVQAQDRRRVRQEPGKRPDRQGHDGNH
jgi:hypothetical protein